MKTPGALLTNAFSYTNLATFERLLQKYIHEHPTVVRIRNFSNEIHRVGIDHSKRLFVYE